MSSLSATRIDTTEQQVMSSADALRDSVGNAEGNVFDVPNFKGNTTISASSHRAAARLNASAITEEEEHAWLAERKLLLDKKFAGALTRHEENRLSYVRWSLDRIEDAKYGETLDNLENRINLYENLLSEVRAFTQQLDRAARSR